ncbi:phage protein [Robbsia andropogonis]|uniref:phage protein n=1 Tax=Robbsia andropogonis TaxID=28092 RepID=UPI00046711E9|nr:hypothetical protein [Robbsia andropogonis]
MSDQWIRKASLIVAGSSDGIDLSDLQFRFSVRNSDDEAPNNAYIRVYNLTQATVRKIVGKGEFTRVILQAGYQTGRFGVIFDGTVRQYATGKENNVDSYLDIMAAHEDVPYTFGMVSQTLTAGSSALDRYQAITKQAGIIADKNAANTLTGGILPRGKVLWGMAKSQLRDIADSQSCRWSIQDGVAVMIPLTGYLPGEAVVLTSQTGLIGIPEANDGGIHAKCLLNPLIKIGQRVQIDNASINQITNLSAVSYASRSSLSMPASVTNDGFYRVMVAEFSGDTRGEQWDTDLVCISIDSTAPAASSVNAQ